MTRVIAVVEGQTEQAFVSEVLAPTFWRNQILLTARLLGRPGHQGGNVKYQRMENDVISLLKQDRACYCTTMLDFYRLGTDFPGVSSPEKGIGKVRRIESQLKEQIAGKIPNLRADRFIPYIQLHEFEALLFSDPDKFAAGIRQPGLANEFKAVRHQCGTPEDINLDQPPSHRLIEQYPAYQKNVDGVRGAKSVGIDSMRSECPHFREWLETLESLGPLSTKS